MTLLGLTAEALLDRFASSDPTPGGGSAAAWAGATGAALVVMVCSMPKTRTGSEEERERLATALGWAREGAERLRRLVDDDTLAYDSVVAAYRLPKASESDRVARSEAIRTAMNHATEVPLATAEACLVVLRAAGIAATHGNPNALSDARSAGALAWAGLTGAAENVKINTAGKAEAAGFRERIEALEAEARTELDALGLGA